MTRGARIDAPGGVHHNMARGIEKRKIFLCEQDVYESIIDLCRQWIFIRLFFQHLCGDFAHVGHDFGRVYFAIS
jgi:hypothetical protein